MSKDTGGAAFPVNAENSGEAGSYPPEPGMNLRQYAAIKLRVPDSGTDWLDAMIRTSLRDELAAKAMQGLCAHPDTWGLATSSKIASAVYELADAMLLEGAK